MFGDGGAFLCSLGYTAALKRPQSQAAIVDLMALNGLSVSAGPFSFVVGHISQVVTQHFR